MIPNPMAARVGGGRYALPVALCVLGLFGSLSPEVHALRPMTRPLARSSSPDVHALRSTNRPALELRDLTVEPAYDRVTISWTTSRPTDSVVKFDGAAATGETWSLAQISTVRHVLVVNGLGSEKHYTARIQATDVDGTITVFAPFEFRTRYGTPPVPRPMPSEGWGCKCGSYKLTRMTPDEREKLRRAIARLSYPSHALTAANKRELVSTKTRAARDDEFNDRLQMARAWMYELQTRGKDVTKWQKSTKILQMLYYTNKMKAAVKLDAFIRELALLDR